jgi:hypothetical protein
MAHTRCVLEKQGYMHVCTHAHADQYVNLLLFHDNNGFVNAPQCYVISKLPVLFVFVSEFCMVCEVNLLNAELNPVCKSQLTELFREGI